MFKFSSKTWNGRDYKTRIRERRARKKMGWSDTGGKTLRIHSLTQLNTHHVQAVAFGDDIPWCIWRQGFLQCSLKPSATEVVRCFKNAHVYFDAYVCKKQSQFTDSLLRARREREREREKGVETLPPNSNLSAGAPMYHDLPSFMYNNSKSLEKLQSTTGSVILYRKVYRKCTITEPVVV